MWLKLDPKYKFGYIEVQSVPRHMHIAENLHLGIDGGLYFYVNGDDVRYDYYNHSIEKVDSTYFYYSSDGNKTMIKNINNGIYDVYFYTEYTYHGEKYSKIGSTYIYYDIEHNSRINKIGGHNIYYDYNNNINQIDGNYISSGYSY